MDSFARRAFWKSPIFSLWSIEAKRKGAARGRPWITFLQAISRAADLCHCVSLLPLHTKASTSHTFY